MTRFTSKLKFMKWTFYVLVFLDMFADSVASAIPVLGSVLNLAGSMVFNLIELLLFVWLLKIVYPTQISHMLKYAMFSMIGLLAIIFILGGLVI